MTPLDLRAIIIFILGCLLVITVLLWWIERAVYLNILLQCADQQTPEKIGRDFYYIVPECRYNLMQAAVMREDARYEALQRYADECA